jgi:transposase-like protein
MTTLQTIMDDRFLHVTLPCPACEHDVHVVVDPVAHRSRWCCIHCSSVGQAPFRVESRPLPAPPVPVASA